MRLSDRRTHHISMKMMQGKQGWRLKGGIAFLMTFGTILHGCDFEPTGPEAFHAEESAGVVEGISGALGSSEKLQLTIGDSVQLEMSTVPGDQTGDSPEVRSVKVSIAREGSYIRVTVPSSAEFNATEIDDSTVTLGAPGGQRVEIARRSNGSLIKVVGGGNHRPVHYYFSARALEVGGSLPSSDQFVLEAEHRSVGKIIGTLSGSGGTTSSDSGSAEASGSWKSSASSVVSVSSTGLAVARGAGQATLTLESGSVVLRTVQVEVVAPPLAGGDAEPPIVEEEPELPTAPVHGSGDLVSYPSAQVAAIVGPQLRSGSSANPWSWYDQNATGHSDKLWSNAGWSDRSHGYYYDHALTQYINYYRTGNTVFLSRAREAADLWYSNSTDQRERSGGYSPREAAISGLILRALDGKPEYWDFITREVERHYSTWLGRRLDYGKLYYGVRDGGYSLLFAAQLAAVHPDAGVRSDMKQKATDASVRYYARLQSPDGGWYWEDPDVGKGQIWEQPFQVGLLLEGLIATHQLTNDPTIERAILKSVEHLFQIYRKDDKIQEAAAKGASWRSVPYFAYPDGRFSGETALAGGWDTNTIREGRQRNTLILHAYGYAYQITRDAKYRAWGDEIFAASFGKGQGPLSDPFYSLADYRGKEYNQAYRTSGRYLAWRLD